MTWTLNRAIANGGPYVPEPLSSWTWERIAAFPFLRQTGHRAPNGSWIVADRLGFNVLSGTGGVVLTDEATARQLAAEWNR